MEARDFANLMWLWHIRCKVFCLVPCRFPSGSCVAIFRLDSKCGIQHLKWRFDMLISKNFWSRKKQCLALKTTGSCFWSLLVHESIFFLTQCYRLTVDLMHANDNHYKLCSISVFCFLDATMMPWGSPEVQKWTRWQMEDAFSWLKNTSQQCFLISLFHHIAEIRFNHKV